MAADFTADFPSTGLWEDVTNGLATQRAMVLDFYHIPSGQHVAFKAMINSFSDQYSSEWSTEAVYGRMDPIAAFQGTARTISVEWDVVAGSNMEARLNMEKIELLMSMLYPSYDGGAMGNSATTISTSPLFKFKFGNFAHDASAGAGSAGARAESAGLVGFIGGFTFEPDFESGIMEGVGDDGVAITPIENGVRPGLFYPQKVTLSAEFTVLHTHGLGWEKNESGAGLGKREAGFPYNTPGSIGASTADAGGSSTGDDDLDEADGIDVTGLPF